MNNYWQSLHWHLRQNPKTGIISGFSSGFIMKFQHLLTDDWVLKVVAGLGTWCSSALAVLTLIIWVIKQVERIKLQRKIKQHEKVSHQPLEQD